MKKLLTLLVAFALTIGCMSFAGCGEKKTNSNSDIKVGFIFLHDESSTYDKNFIDAAKDVCAELGVTYDIKTGIDESNDCYEAAAEYADDGYQLVFADSFGHEAYMLQAAREFPDVQFCHATGTQAHTAGVANYHNAFATIYEGRFLAGVAAGLKLNEMIANDEFTAAEAKMGYVGAFPYAEVVSGYTSFYLGAKSVCPTVTMEVRYTNSWYNLTDEKSTALALINNGCKLISQHADSSGAPSACEEKGVPNVSYNGSTKNYGPNTYIISSKINWRPYFRYIINAVINGTSIETDWTGTIATGSVELAELNTAVAAAGTQEKLDEVKAKLANGTLHVFDTSTFTVGGVTLTSYLADVDDYGDFIRETEVISNGYFHESEFRSAPYFDLRIDGITEA